MKLDELARHSSLDARVSVSHLDLPPIGEHAPRRRWTPVVAGVAVTALVVGGLAVLARDRSGGDAPASAESVLPSVVEVPRLGLAVEGWSVAFAEELGASNDAAEAPTFVYYGTAGSDDPFGDGDLLIGAFADADDAPASPESPDEETIELRGTTATVSSGTDQGLPVDATSIMWSERDADGAAAEIVLVSRAFDAERLAQIAEALSIDVAAAVVTPADDLGLDHVATASGTPFDAMRGTSEGFVVAYQSSDGRDFTVISTARGELAREAAALRWWSEEVQDIDVSGRPGVLATFAESMPDLGPIVAWSPADGVVATVSSFGSDGSVDPAELAATAFEVDDATWAVYLDATESSRAGAGEFDEIFGQSEGSVGDTEYRWVLGLQGANRCFNIETGDQGTGSCQEHTGFVAPPAGTARTVDNGFGDVVAHVVIAADPNVDDIVETRGVYEIFRVEADGVSWFVAIGDASVQPSFDVIVDGAVVDTIEAAVEAPAEIELDLGTNSAAVELGVDGMAIALSGATDSGLVWSIGRQDGDLCLVTDGTEPSAICAPADDVVVFPPAETSDGAVSFVVVRDAPDCIDAFTVDGTVIDAAGGGGDEQHDYDYWIAFGRSDGWTLELTAGSDRTSIELPVDLGSVPYPPDVCG